MKTRWICLGVLLLVLCLLLCACGEAKLSEGSAPSNDAGSRFGTDTVSERATVDPAATMPPKIIRTAEVSAETKAFDDTLTLLRAKITAVGGYISDSRTRAAGEDSGRSANMTVRVPAEKLDEFLGYVENHVHVTTSSVSSNDVSTHYYDVQARLETLRAEKTALDDMLSHASTTGEALAIRAQLSDVTQNIESYEAQIRLYDERIAYSTVNVYLDEVVVFSPDSERFGARVSNAFRESWSGFRTFWVNVFLFVVYALPFILVLVVLLALGLTILFIRRRKKANASREHKNSQLK